MSRGQLVNFWHTAATEQGNIDGSNMCVYFVDGSSADGCSSSLGDNCFAPFFGKAFSCLFPSYLFPRLPYCGNRREFSTALVLFVPFYPSDYNLQIHAICKASCRTVAVSVFVLDHPREQLHASPRNAASLQDRLLNLAPCIAV